MISRSDTSDKLEVWVTPAPATPELENVVAEAARAANVPVAFVGFLEKAGESVKAARGWNVAVIPPAVSFAIRIANQTDVVVVPDTTLDVRFSSHPLVTGAPNIRFYAGAPLQVRAGINIGSLCIIDRAPRDFSAEEQGGLSALAALTVSEILGWRAVRKLDASQKRLAQTARMAKIGGFEFNRTSDKHTWDDMIYSLYGIPLGTPPANDLIVSR